MIAGVSRCHFYTALLTGVSVRLRIAGLLKVVPLLQAAVCRPPAPREARSRPSSLNNVHRSPQDAKPLCRYGTLLTLTLHMLLSRRYSPIFHRS